MERELEQELLNSPIGELGTCNEQDDACMEAQIFPCCSSRPAVALHENHASSSSAATIPILAPFHSPLPVANSFLSVSSLGERAASFIEQVLRILDDAQSYSFEHIVSWQPDASSFKVHRIRDFETQILPRYLEQTKIRSFQRQLIKHGFQRIQGGANRGAYHHPKFVRSDRTSCLSIEKVKRSRSFDEADKSKPPVVKLDEMSAHFQQAVLESKPSSLPCRGKNNSNGEEKNIPADGIHQQQTDNAVTSAASLGQLGSIFARTPMHESSNTCFSTTHSRGDSPIDDFPFPTTGLYTSPMSSMDRLSPQHHRRNAVKSLPESAQTKNLLNSEPRSALSLDSMSQKVILSKFLPSRLPGDSFATDLNASEFFSKTPSPPQIESPTSFEKFSLSNLITVKPLKSSKTGDGNTSSRSTSPSARIDDGTSPWEV